MMLLVLVVQCENITHRPCVGLCRFEEELQKKMDAENDFVISKKVGDGIVRLVCKVISVNEVNEYI